MCFLTRVVFILIRVPSGASKIHLKHVGGWEDVGGWVDVGGVELSSRMLRMSLTYVLNSN